MFVGQIPKDWNEQQCHELFSEYGEIHSLNLLRERNSNLSKGCLFITYYTRKDALNAQNKLHNVRKLPGINYPIQMKPADAENRNERKLFIGQWNKKNCNEEAVREMFSKFGHIEECTVLRDANGNSKGELFFIFFFLLSNIYKKKFLVILLIELYFIGNDNYVRCIIYTDCIKGYY
jgi:RNA recognition motif-containing protein